MIFYAFVFLSLQLTKDEGDVVWAALFCVGIYLGKSPFDTPHLSSEFDFRQNPLSSIC
jgi:hypothetical protein